MNVRIPVSLTPDLVLRLGAKSARLTPAAGFDLAQKLIRASSRELVRQEVGQAHVRVSPKSSKQVK